MLVVGKTDSFERKYMGKFRSFAAEFGEIVSYERDRAAWDIGIHLTHRLSSGQERLSAALCWFQMKGIMDSTLSVRQYENAREISTRIKVKHLKHWYLQPMPTYLAIYVECVDKFLVTNIQEYIARIWSRGILTLDQDTAKISISKKSILDEQAFQLILRKSDFAEYQRALGADDSEVHLCMRDYSLIWHFGTAAERQVEHRLVYWDWQSKTRGQLFIEERAADSNDDWFTLREHWQYRMDISELGQVYPYLEFRADADREDALSWEYMDGEYGAPCITLQNGELVCSEDAAGEYFYYEMRAHLNEIGSQAFERVKQLIRIELIQVTPGTTEMISVAPWHNRDV